ncbi:MAG: deoxyribose-phosphate aldolase [Clostridiales bacterium]|nr:deoxyribose-phosphate aldolase [Clostridiales bacterium]
MDIQDILGKCDHTQLSVTATWADIRALIDDGIKYKTASVCIPPCYVHEAKQYAQGKIAICTVIGFPNGYNSKEVKVFETVDAVKNGADEIDMVINIGDLKAGNYQKIQDEIVAIKAACNGKLLKVIIETCLLTEQEKIKMCEIVTAAKADYIKTSTGFSKAGATREDVIIFNKHVGKDVKIKAAGGISSVKDAEDFVSLGASRLGTSRIVKIVKEEGLL